MMRRLAWVVILALIVGWCPPVWAALTVTTDHRPVFFGLVKPGDTKELSQQGAYHHEITCSSTNGRPWYLKLHALQPLSSGSATIPLERFQWQLAFTTGAGTAPTLQRFTPFSLIPQTVYRSAPGEQDGTIVTLQFTYRLDVPEVQRSGTYHTTLRVTLVEVE